jgi:anti-anti-sigma factor
VNLAAVTFFDSSALKVLVGAHAALTRLARRLVVVDPAASTRRLFELTGLLSMFGLGCG